VPDKLSGVFTARVKYNIKSLDVRSPEVKFTVK